MEKFLRDWRQDALNKHQYDSAIFIGDKLLALTSTTPHAIASDSLTDIMGRQ
jgi:anaphase-promoting complex subunit 6